MKENIVGLQTCGDQTLGWCVCPQRSLTPGKTGKGKKCSFRFGVRGFSWFCLFQKCFSFPGLGGGRVQQETRRRAKSELPQDCDGDDCEGEIRNPEIRSCNILTFWCQIWSKKKCWKNRKGVMDEGKHEFGREILCASTEKSSGWFFLILWNFFFEIFFWLFYPLEERFFVRVPRRVRGEDFFSFILEL